jgi:glycosyltransferase involved in cell wall biosynthesis
MTQSHKLISVDARTLYQPTRRGIGKTLLELYRHLAAVRPEWRFIMFHQLDVSDDPFSGIPNITHKKIDIYGDRFDFWQQIRLPLAARRAGVDLLHCPANTAPRYPLVPMVVTIHDLIPMESSVSRIGRKWANSVNGAIHRAVRIITPSEYTKRKIVERFGDWTDKIRVSPWAPVTVSCKVKDIQELSRVRAKYGLPAAGEYVLGFGAAEPRKNTRRILLAWKALPEKLQKEVRLILLGIDKTAMVEFQAIIDELEISQSVILQGFADETDLPALLSGATVICYPSLSEGFGLPILEGFAAETAMLSGDMTSLPEVAGDAALLVHAEEVSAITEGLTKLLENEQYRADLVRKGRDRLRFFTWQACAERLAALFEEVLNHDGGSSNGCD